MLARTHFIAGAAAGIATGEPVNMLVCGLSALLPDVDHAGSWLGRRTPGVSWSVQAIFGHRGAVHSLPGALVFSWLIPFLAAKAGLLVPWQPVLFGFLTHLILDSLNPGGVAWLWPLPWRLALPLTRTGGVLERYLLNPALVLAAVYFYLL